MNKTFNIELSEKTLQKLKEYFGTDIDTDAIQQALTSEINEHAEEWENAEHLHIEQEEITVREQTT